MKKPEAQSNEIRGAIKKMLAPPAFKNEEQARVARILTIILWAVIFVVSGLILTWWLVGKTDELGPYAFVANTVIVSVAVGLLFLVRRGHLSLASCIFVGFLWANISFQAFTSDGLRGSAAIIYLAIMVLASLLLDWRASIGIAVLSILTIWVLARIELSGAISFQLDGPYEVALETTAIIILTAVLLTLTTTGLRNALQRARRSENSLGESNQTLQRNIEQLRQTEEILRVSEAKYRELVQHANSIILRLDTRGHLTYFNEFAQAFFGYTEDEILGKPVVGHIVPEKDSSGRNLAIMIKELIEQPDAYISNENENIRKNGERVWIAWTNKTICDDRGEIMEILCIGNDISARKKAESEIIQSEEKFRNIVNSSPMGIHLYKLDPNGRLIFTAANPSADHILGLDNTQFIGKTLEDAFPPLADTEIPERYRKTCLEGKAWRTEQIDYADEQIKGAFEVHAFQTSPGMMAAMFFDITERKQTNEALKESEERFRVLFEHAPDPFYINRMDGTLVDGNKAAEKLTGYKREELMGTKFSELGLISNSDFPRVLELLKKNREDKPTGPDEFKLFRKNGAPAYVELSTHPVSIKGEKIVLGIARDISERKKTESGKKRLEAQLRQAQKMEAIGTFAGGIAHDFNNILSAIVGYTELALAKTPKDNALYEYFQEVFGASLRARDLVKQILTFSRQAEQQMQPVQVNLIVREILKFLRSSLPSSIEIRHDIISDARVLADPTQIHQVLMNLCANAKHAMRETGGVLEISLRDVHLGAEFAALHPLTVQGPHLKLSVADSGEGIPREILDKIFDPFFTTKGKREGTGLGLAVVHGIIKNSGGHINVVS
jgi:PAS domain S-box-containing protein